MNRSRRSWAPGLLLATLACVSVLAEDRRFALPEGWSFGGVAVGSDRVAYSGSQMAGPEGEQHVARSRIFQRIGDKTVTTDFDGACSVDAYSPDGRLLLVRQIDPAAGSCCSCPFRAVLIDAHGAVVAQLEYGHRAVGFSTTGEVLYVGASCGSLACMSGSRIDVYDLAGTLVRTIEPGPFVDQVVLGDGSDVVLRDEHGLRRLHVGERPHAAWTLNLPPPEYPGERLISISPDKILVLGMAGFAVVDVDGVPWVRFEPASPSFSVRPGPPDNLWLIRRDGDQLLDVERNLLQSIRVDRTPPVDFEMLDPSGVPDEYPGYLVFIGKREMLIRSFPEP